MSDEGALAQQLREFISVVWDGADIAAADDYLASTYTIHSDPGDPWEGRSLTREEFKQRLMASRAPFPDLHFELDDVLAGVDRVAASWTLHGTQSVAMGPVAATGRVIAVRGMTIYYFEEGRIAGHRQVVDRLAVLQQLGLQPGG